jgi:hypothetical protein
VGGVRHLLGFFRGLFTPAQSNLDLDFTPAEIALAHATADMDAELLAWLEAL